MEEYGLTNEISEEIRYHLLASECSDWFWWYGEDHVSDFSSEFDALFREHLIHIYRLMKREIPSELLESIITRYGEKSSRKKPNNMISPCLDEKKNTFFDWLGCGMVDETKSFSTMDRKRGPVNMIYYGFDDRLVYVAFEGDFSTLTDVHIEVIIEETGKRIAIDPSALAKRLEFGVSRINFNSNTSVHLRFELIQEKKIIQTIPANGPLLINLDENFRTNWFI